MLGYSALWRRHPQAHTKVFCPCVDYSFLCFFRCVRCLPNQTSHDTSSGIRGCLLLRTIFLSLPYSRRAAHRTSRTHVSGVLIFLGGGSGFVPRPAGVRPRLERLNTAAAAAGDRTGGKASASSVPAHRDKTPHSGSAQQVCVTAPSLLQML